MSNLDKEIDALKRFESNRIITLPVFVADQIKLYEALKKAEEALQFLSRGINGYVEDWMKPDEWALKEWARKADEGVKAIEDIWKE